MQQTTRKKIFFQTPKHSIQRLAKTELLSDGTDRANGLPGSSLHKHPRNADVWLRYASAYLGWRWASGSYTFRTATPKRCNGDPRSRP